ncbi:MAG: hypothetical protein AAB407_03100 [Patescibacteria group bacterium]
MLYVIEGFSALSHEPQGGHVLRVPGLVILSLIFALISGIFADESSMIFFFGSLLAIVTAAGSIILTDIITTKREKGTLDSITRLEKGVSYQVLAGCTIPGSGSLLPEDLDLDVAKAEEKWVGIVQETRSRKRFAVELSRAPKGDTIAVIDEKAQPVGDIASSLA